MMTTGLKRATTTVISLALGASALLISTVLGAQEIDPDVPRFAKPTNTVFVKEEFMARRAEGAARKRGLHPGKPVSPILRQNAIAVMETQQREVSLRAAASGQIDLTAAWQEMGPNPIPNGQVVSGPSTAASGRTIAIAVHPTHPNIVYVGTAQGGLYRSINGGTTWTAMMDNALSMAIGTIAIVPSQPDTIFVGTGEPQFSIDSFFGVGIYRIDNASTASPTIVGPFGGAEFAGRSVSKIAVHPTDANIFFASSASGLGGIGGTPPVIAPSRGLFRTTNALSAAPTFTRLTGLNANANNSVRDFVIDPLNANLLVANVVAGGGLGGIYVSNDALAVAPAFIQRVVFNSSATSLLTAEFAIHHTAGPNPTINPTIYAATGNPASGSTTVANGRVLRSIDSGVTWTTQITNGFCGGQCFYDIAIAVHPTNSNTVYLGGSPALVFGRSLDGGLTFTNNATTASGLHGDTHAIAVAPSLPSTIYFGSDGGIDKSTDSGTTWTPLNNSTFKATQFMSIAVHPIDPNFTIGGTQDNGTNFFEPAGTWRRADFGDGGYAVVDQSALNTTAVNMYHTYFNDSSLQGYGFVSTTASASDGAWTLRGCGGNVAGNGIPCGGAVLFYAPLEQGPGTPNTIYFGANILYRSDDRGLNHTAASQNLGTAISAIGISRQNDNVRIVGQADGGLFGTTTGSAALTNLDAGGVIPANFIARAVIDPNNVNTAYVTLSAYGVANVWRTANLSNASPTWTAITGTAGNVLPQIPVSAFIVDPANSANLYAGTDIGVYVSTDSGANWTPFGTGLPRVAVFDMAKTSGGLIRIATHGRGLWQIEAVGFVPGPLPDLTVSKSHTGNFAQGQIGAAFSAIVTNSGAAPKPAGASVTVTEVPPIGLTLTAMSGGGWTCTTLPTCTRSDALASGATYPPIAITVTVAPGAAASVSNGVNVTTSTAESNTGNNSSPPDVTTIVTGTAGSLAVTKAGSGTGGVVSFDGGINCGATCTASYVNSSNLVLTATATGGSVFTGWLGTCTGIGSCAVIVNGATKVKATFALAPFTARILDIDANLQYLPESDGVIILRYLFGLTGSALTTGALGSGATRGGEPQMTNYLIDILPYLDVDGNGRVEASTDGVMIVRKLLGLSGTSITQGAMSSGATRLPADIDAYIQTLKPP